MDKTLYEEAVGHAGIRFTYSTIFYYCAYSKATLVKHYALIQSPSTQILSVLVALRCQTVHDS